MLAKRYGVAPLTVYKIKKPVEQTPKTEVQFTKNLVPKTAIQENRTLAGAALRLEHLKNEYHALRKEMTQLLEQEFGHLN